MPTTPAYVIRIKNKTAETGALGPTPLDLSQALGVHTHVLGHGDYFLQIWGSFWARRQGGWEAGRKPRAGFLLPGRWVAGGGERDRESQTISALIRALSASVSPGVCSLVCVREFGTDPKLVK